MFKIQTVFFYLSIVVVVVVGDGAPIVVVIVVVVVVVRPWGRGVNLRRRQRQDGRSRVALHKK